MSKRNPPWNSKRRKKTLRALLERDGPRCWICGNAIDLGLPSTDREAVSIDHVVPRAHGGTSAYFNLRLAHIVCNEVRAAPDVASEVSA